MNFGTNAVFDYVCKMLTDPESEADYQTLYNIVREDCQQMLRSCNLPQEDKEDIIQNVQISVFSGLVRYVEKFFDASEAQRNAFLRTIIARRRDDLLANRYKHGHVASYDATDFPMDLCGAQEDTLTAFSNRSELLHTLHYICTLHFPPQQIIAYLLGRCTAMSGKNAKPAVVAAQLGGMTLTEAARFTIGKLQEECPFPIDPQVYAPLMQKLKQANSCDTDTEERFDLSPKAISDSASRIAAQLRKHRDHENGGNTL